MPGLYPLHRGPDRAARFASAQGQLISPHEHLQRESTDDSPGTSIANAHSDEPVYDAPLELRLLTTDKHDLRYSKLQERGECLLGARQEREEAARRLVKRLTILNLVARKRTG